MPTVKAKAYEPFDSLYNRFKAVVENSGVLQEYRNRQHYLKPSAKKKLTKIAQRKANYLKIKAHEEELAEAKKRTKYR